MKFSSTTVFCVAAITSGIGEAFTPLVAFGGAISHQHATTASSSTSRFGIRPKTDKSDELRFGWDGTTALGMCFKHMTRRKDLSFGLIVICHCVL
jgi:hypothetical protein